MKKKALALLMTATMMVGSLAACGSTPAAPATGDAGSAEPAATEAPAEKTEEAAPADAAGGSGAGMTFTWWGNQVRNDRTNSAIELYMSENAGVTIDGQPAEWTDYWTKLSTSAAGNAMPDIVQMDYKYMMQYVNNDLLLDLTPYVESGLLNLDDCNQDIVNAGKVGDGLYAICIGINSPALLYNKTVTDAAGVEIKDNMTMDEFIEVCKTISEKTGYKTNISYNNGENFIEYYLRANDVVMFEPEGKMGGTADDYAEYLSILEQGIKEGWHLSAEVLSSINVDSVEESPLVSGSSPETMSWCGFAYTNQLVATKNAAPADADIQMTTWPSKDPKKSDYLKPGQFISVSKQALDRGTAEEAVKFVNWFTNSVDCNNVLLAERGIPLSTVVADAVAPNLTEDEQSIVKFLNEVVAKTSSQINPPTPDGYAEVANKLKELEEQVAYGQMTSAEAGQVLYDFGNEKLAEAAAAAGN